MQAPRTPAALLAGLVLLAAACGDDSDDNDSVDNDTDGTEEGAPADNAADSGDYCEVAKELDQADAPPTDEQLEALARTAPDEIAEHVDYVVEVMLEQGFQAFFEDDVQEHFGPIDAYEQEVCGIEGDSGEPAELPPGVSLEPDPDAQQVAVSASDYAFDFEAPAAGPVSFVMTNDGDEVHHMIVARLAEGVSLDEALESDPDVDGLVEFYAETDVAPPGGEGVLTFEDLEPGHYAMACFIPDADGTPHAFLGMATDFTVE